MLGRLLLGSKRFRGDVKLPGRKACDILRLLKKQIFSNLNLTVLKILLLNVYKQTKETIPIFSFTIFHRELLGIYVISIHVTLLPQESTGTLQ